MIWDRKIFKRFSKQKTGKKFSLEIVLYYSRKIFDLNGNGRTIFKTLPCLHTHPTLSLPQCDPLHLLSRSQGNMIWYGWRPGKHIILKNFIYRSVILMCIGNTLPTCTFYSFCLPWVYTLRVLKHTHNKHVVITTT